ncbi:hypothetical protein Achl_4213 (plasmid) [Pseudarthrobacter chlorophenolicus A6]|uniref:Uncharacterized protein n=1 Tax=Pseudarthrobacter chlorophenolicus (strain ATCC 700700 / DSM 12829 / CIP 107037 / JCM 12360 / KCTC 9906 / NCIMB 13794 / A6) TaxID=452863 RepID=B8HIB7_PSECP|nr:hypothetical protein [Pseudarthrobacter chlorophenolicus]ACL42164.1 hypothetical protein Achl_4213 [Pseudarthrobacter chlorophenolicus A6]SDQ14282.1 hypothetical protein SAMN04489738_0271 [Pseudarthrobacter chlorophenolicus]
MSIDRTRQPKGVPVGGQFAATAHNESGVTLAAPRSSISELAAYGEIPAPLEHQTMADGSPAEASFEESYRAFFRPLDDHEAVHGPYEPDPSLSEGEILELAGIADANLGRHHGTYLERDEDSGDPVIVVHTRNGGGNRECYSDPCDGTCTGCIQTDAIPALPTYLRDTDDEDDRTYANNYFRPLDAAAGLAALEAQERRTKLNELTYYRKAITEGTQPPWVVLSPVRGKADRARIYRELERARQSARNDSQRRGTADAVLAALENGTPMPGMGSMMRVPVERSRYDSALKFHKLHTAEGQVAREAADTLAAEMKQPLPPATASLVGREHAKLTEEAARHEEQAAENEAKLEVTSAVMRTWAWSVKEQADKTDAEVEAAAQKLKDFDWSESYPGPADECPARKR